MTRPLAFLTALALCAAGCTSARPAATTEADATLRAIEAGYRSTPDMALEGNVRVGGLGVTVWVDALIRGRDSMKITLIGPFAIPLGAMSATRERFEFYKADEDIVLIGTPDRPTFEKLLMIPLDYDELVSLLRGEIPRVPQPGEYEVTADGPKLLFVARRGATLERITVDPEGPVVTAYDRSRSTGDSLVPELSITYSQFATFGGRRLARRASVDVAGGAQTVSVAVERIEPEIPADASLALEVDPGVERIVFRP